MMKLVTRSIVLILVTLMLSFSSLAVDNYTAEDIKEMLNEGINYYLQDDFQVALDFFSGVIECDQDNEDAYYWRSQVYSELEEYVKAILDIRELIRLKPEVDRYWGNLAWHLILTEDFTEANKAAEKAYQLSNQDKRIITILAHTYFLINEKEEAEKHYQQALELFESKEDLEYILAHFDLFIKRGWSEELCNIQKEWVKNTYQHSVRFYQYVNKYQQQAKKLVEEGKNLSAAEEFIFAAEIEKMARTPRLDSLIALYQEAALNLKKAQEFKREKEYLRKIKEIAKLKTERNPAYYYSCIKEVAIKGGKFHMGSNQGMTTEMPRHEVQIDDFYLGRYEITFKEYFEFLNDQGVTPDGYDQDGDLLIEKSDEFNPLLYNDGFSFQANEMVDDPHSPVMELTWIGAIKYCNWLSDKRGLARAYNHRGEFLDVYGDLTDDITKVEGYRLPTEAEWEYAAAGGRKMKHTDYAGSNKIDEVAWSETNSQGKLHPVGSLNPNELYLFDMSGNLSEWCQDTFDPFGYESHKKVNPCNFYPGIGRVIRGGCISDNNFACRVKSRIAYDPQRGANFIGFRIARSA